LARYEEGCGEARTQLPRLPGKQGPATSPSRTNVGDGRPGAVANDVRRPGGSSTAVTPTQRLATDDAEPSKQMGRAGSLEEGYQRERRRQRKATYYSTLGLPRNHHIG
jgi:hypothetical protein